MRGISFLILKSLTHVTEISEEYISKTFLFSIMQLSNFFQKLIIYNVSGIFLTKSTCFLENKSITTASCIMIPETVSVKVESSNLEM